VLHLAAQGEDLGERPSSSPMAHAPWGSCPSALTSKRRPTSPPQSSMSAATGHVQGVSVGYFPALTRSPPSSPPPMESPPPEEAPPPYYYPYPRVLPRTLRQLRGPPRPRICPYPEYTPGLMPPPAEGPHGPRVCP